MESIENYIQEFISHCIFEKNLSNKTIKAYSIDCSQFVEYLKSNKYSIEISRIDKLTLRSFVQSLSKFKPKTVKRKIATLKALFNFFEFEDRIMVNPFRKLRLKIRYAKELPRVMNGAEVQSMIRSTYLALSKEKRVNTYAYKERVRDVAIFEILFATGARVSEISHLKKNAINLEDGELLLMGKGSKERRIQICNEESLLALRDYYKLFSKEIGTCGYFFVNRFGGMLSEQSIRFLVKTHAKRVGLDRIITPHVFRHSFATLLLEEGVDVKYIQHLLGHSSITTTQIYTHVNNEKQRKILRQNHPRGNFNVYESIKF